MHTRRYSAFISYRHADNTQEGRRWAEWLHHGLERYVVPPDLKGTPDLRSEPNADDPTNGPRRILHDEECFCEELRFGRLAAELEFYLN